MCSPGIRTGFRRFLCSSLFKNLKALGFLLDDVGLIDAWFVCYSCDEYYIKG